MSEDENQEYNSDSNDSHDNLDENGGSNYHGDDNYDDDNNSFLDPDSDYSGEEYDYNTDDGCTGAEDDPLLRKNEKGYYEAKNPGGFDPKNLTRVVADIPKERSKNFAKRTAQIAYEKISSGTLWKLLTDPTTWIVAGIITAITYVVFYIIASFGVYGKSEVYTCLPSAGFSNGGGAASGSKVTGMKNYDRQESEEHGIPGYKHAAQIADWLTSTSFKVMGNKPFSPEQAAAVIGNFWQESQLNPNAVQGGNYNANSNEVKTSHPNSQAKSRCDAGGKALGILQMDGLRCRELVELAEEMGSHWSDLNVQMEFFRREFDEEKPGLGNYFKAGNINYKGFDQPGKTVEEYTIIFNCSYERSGDCTQRYHNGSGWQYIRPDLSHATRMQREKKRIDYAIKFMSVWRPGASGAYSGGGNTCACLNSTGQGADAIVQTAIDMSYNTIAEAVQNRMNPKPSYRDGKLKLLQDPNAYGHESMPGLFDSCDRFVATVIKTTVDPKIPWGNATMQGEYMVNSPDWQEVERNAAQPGDIWFRPAGTVASQAHGHIAVHLESLGGSQIKVAHASYGSRVAGIGTANYPDRSYMRVFRYVGNGAATNSAVRSSSGVCKMTNNSGFVLPSQGSKTSPYGYRNHPIFRTPRLHAGVDLAGDKGLEIVAAKDGQVIRSGQAGGYGLMIEIDHGGGTTTRYAHLSKLGVGVGAQVTAGQPIGTMGTTGTSTGIHLHFEIRENGMPVDPEQYLTFNGR